MADFGYAIRANPQKTDHEVPEAGTAFILPSRIPLPANDHRPRAVPVKNTSDPAVRHRSRPTDKGMKIEAPAARAGAAVPDGLAGCASSDGKFRSAKIPASRHPGAGDSVNGAAAALPDTCSSGAILAT